MRKTVFIPIEVVDREIDSKILFSTKLASLGFQVVLGHKGVANSYISDLNSDGVYFYKSAKSENIQIYQDKGLLFVAQDEEAGVTYSDYSKWVNDRTSLLDADQTDMFFTWGKDEYEFLTIQNQFSKNKIKNLGSLRGSLWGSNAIDYYQEEICKIRSKFKKYILIILTAPIEDYYLFNKSMKDNKELHVDRYISHLTKTLIDSLLEDFDYTIVVRPHPADTGKTWSKLYRKNPRVHINLTGPATPWVSASECVINYGSTAGIESIAAGKTTFDVREGFFFHQSYHETADWQKQFSQNVRNYNELRNSILELKNQPNFKDMPQFERRLKNINSLNSINDIALEIYNLAQNNHTKERNIRINYKMFVYTYILTWHNYFTNRRLFLHDKYKRAKIKKNYVISKVDKSRKLLGVDETIKVKTLANSCFLIYPES